MITACKCAFAPFYRYISRRRAEIRMDRYGGKYINSMRQQIGKRYDDDDTCTVGSYISVFFFLR